MYYLKYFCLIALLTEVYGNHPLRNCDEKWLAEDSTLYKLGNQLIQLSYDQRYSMQPFPQRYEVLVMHGCQSDHPVEAKVLDPEEIFSTAYHAEIWNVELPPMPESSQLNVVTLRDAVPGSVWGSCNYVYYLFMQRADLSRMPSDWLTNCTHLRQLTLDAVTVAQARAVLASAPAVEELVMSNIDEIADLIKHSLFPKSSENHLIRLEIGVLTEAEVLPANITWADVSGALMKQISSLTNLNELHIIYFKRFNFCATGGHSAVTLNSVLSLEVSDTDTSQLCFKSLRVMPNLSDVRLKFNNFNELEFSELYSSKAPKLSISFDNSRIMRLQFTRDDYLALNDGKNRGHISLSVRSNINCDCGQSLWLARALREGLITELQVACTDGSSVFTQKCEALSCDRLYCQSPCICCRDSNNTIIVDCRDTDLHEWPTDVLLWENVSSLLAPNLSHISALPKYLPESLRFLDISGNDVLLKAREEEMAVLFWTKARRVRLAGNGVVCSCYHKPVLQMLKYHSDQIEDFEKLVCVDDGRRLTDVDFGNLCAKRDRDTAVLTSVSTAFLLTALALSVGLFMYYRKEVQIYLFARGWCLCLVKEDGLDADRRYDVFLSFCHEDTDFVLQHLLPTLDEKYSVCVHIRDWYLGEMILTQITDSINNSRRTVVVMSRNFVNSLWGLLEFRTAHLSGLEEGRIRLVMVVIDDILEEDQLLGEIRSYVRLHTYVKWGDPWFWDKLNYALPHNPRPRSSVSKDFVPNAPRHEMIEFPN